MCRGTVPSKVGKDVEPGWLAALLLIGETAQPASLCAASLRRGGRKGRLSALSTGGRQRCRNVKGSSRLARLGDHSLT